MNCPVCGMRALDGANFCDKCGTPLRQAREVGTYAEPRRVAAQPGRGRAQDPYKEEIKQLRLQIKQLKIYLKQITTKMSSTRARYHETDAFVPRGLLHKGYKILEDVRLLGPQQQKEQLQRQIMQMEQELLGLQQAQAEWQRQML